MTLARLSDLLVPAAASGKGLGAFNVFSIEHAEAFTAAAEVAKLPSSCRSLRMPCATTEHWHRSDSPL